MPTSPATLVYTFAEGRDLDADERRARLGGKGAALVRMTELGLPVPPGFTLTTDACRRYLAEGWFDELDAAIAHGLARIEHETGRRLGTGDDPLLVSVRSGAPVSMPGMMDTVLDVGVTPDVAAALTARSGDAAFARDTTARFVRSYATIVAGAPAERVDELIAAHLGTPGASDPDPAAATRGLWRALAKAGHPIPDDPTEQIRRSVAAVFASWNTERARVYRRVEGIADDLGTAATVQTMTFGNRGERSGTGVAFTRDPTTGAPGLVGDFLPGAQGEDVVAGTHATRSLADMAATWPDLAARLASAAEVLERDLVDMADIEFTVEDGRLWLLQVRPGKRSPRAALRIAIDLARDPAFPLDRAGAIDRVAHLLDDPPTAAAPTSPEAPTVLARGLAASPGRAVGVLSTDVDDTLARAARGQAVVLVRRETSPADVAGMAEAVGLVTTLGGLVSHAAVVARSWGIPAVVGADAIEIAPDGIHVDGRFVAAGATVTVDGDDGTVLLGAHPGRPVELEEVRILRAWRAEAARAATEPADEAPTAETPAVDPPAADAPAADAPAADPPADPDLDEMRRVVALKGVASVDTLVAALGRRADEVVAGIDALLAAGDATAMPGGRIRLTPTARAGVDEWYARRAEVLAPVVEPLLDDFHRVDRAFKALVTAWQTDGAGTRDALGVLVDRLAGEIHPTVTTVIAAAAAVEPRLARYRERLETALAAVAAGDAAMLAHPLGDSYHTVWFELHEELIRLAGRDRGDEAAAGRA